MIDMDDLAYLEYKKFRDKRDQELLAQTLGWMLLQWEMSLDKVLLVEQVKSNAEKCLVDIAAILDREELNDFHCVDEIIQRLGKEGLSTSRHDFG